MVVTNPPLWTKALPSTDLLILTCTRTPETVHMIHADTLRLFPPTALVVNIGRGPWVAYDALRDALEDNRIAGLASSEPWDPADALSRHPHTLFTPHVGGWLCGLLEWENGRVGGGCNRERDVGERPPAVWVNGVDG